VKRELVDLLKNFEFPTYVLEELIVATTNGYLLDY